MAVIHVPPKACWRCAESKMVAIVPPETRLHEPREREPQRELGITIPFVRQAERTDRASPPGRSGLRRLDALRSGI